MSLHVRAAPCRILKGLKTPLLVYHFTFSTQLSQPATRYQASLSQPSDTTLHQPYPRQNHGLRHHHHSRHHHPPTQSQPSATMCKAIIQVTMCKCTFVGCGTGRTENIHPCHPASISHPGTYEYCNKVTGGRRSGNLTPCKSRRPKEVVMSEVMTWATTLCSECIKLGCPSLDKQALYHCRPQEVLLREVQDDELWDWLEFYYIHPEIHHEHADYVAGNPEGSKH